MSNPKAALPYLEDQLLAALDAMFPPQPITPRTPLEQIMFNAGQQDVIARLKQASAHQRKTS